MRPKSQQKKGKAMGETKADDGTPKSSGAGDGKKSPDRSEARPIGPRQEDDASDASTETEQEDEEDDKSRATANSEMEIDLVDGKRKRKRVAATPKPNQLEKVDPPSPYNFPQQKKVPQREDFIDLYIRLGFSDEVADYLAKTEGIDSCETLSSQTDSDIDTICSVIRKGQDGIDRMSIPITAQQNLKLAVFEMKHWLRAAYYTGAMSWIGKASIQSYRKQKELEKKYKGWNYDDMPAFDKLDLNKTFEQLEERLARERGVDGFPASYVIRAKVKVASQWSKDIYRDLDEEMAHRALIIPLGPNLRLTDAQAAGHYEKTSSFKIHNAEVYKFLKKWAEPYVDVAQHVKRFNKEKDGRGAFMALRKHYLGEQHINQTANAAEAELNSLHYEGNTKGFG